ncbi:MAG: response regulator transcription factor [Acidimicrobiia bacterium]|nr:response regulator transcription factor [Acidimicrobiia bacterium]
MIVDLHRPGGGMRLVEALAEHTAVPVMVLSGDHDEAVKVRALDAGAEDYVTKPFAAGELLARVRVMLRRRGRTGADVAAGALTLLPSALSVRGPGGTAEVTPTEFELLRALAGADGFVTTGDLLAEV